LGLSVSTVYRPILTCNTLTPGGACGSGSGQKKVCAARILVVADWDTSSTSKDIDTSHGLPSVHDESLAANWQPVRRASARPIGTVGGGRAPRPAHQRAEIQMAINDDSQK